jgi:DDE family transposase
MLGFRCLGKIQRGILAVANCSQGSFGFPACRKRAVEVDFSGGAVSSNGGVLLLRAADCRLGLSAAAARVLRDPRDPGRCRHSGLAQLRQRLYGLALGYEDLNDHGELRPDLALQTAVDRGTGVCLSRSIEETPRSEIGEFSPLPSAYAFVGHRRAEERRQRHAAMGDGDVVAGPLMGSH